MAGCLPLLLGVRVGKVRMEQWCCQGVPQQHWREKGHTDPLAKLGFLITGVLGGTTMKRVAMETIAKD